VDCIIFAVAHNEFKSLGLAEISKLYKAVPESEKVLIDVKGLFSVKDLDEAGLSYWRL
jgi:UDP-N-acetyl-D-galactosamine dehydrogenase